MITNGFITLNEEDLEVALKWDPVQFQRQCHL